MKWMVNSAYMNHKSRVVESHDIVEADSRSEAEAKVSKMAADANLNSFALGSVERYREAEA